MGDIFDLFVTGPTDYTRSFVPDVIADSKAGLSVKRDHLLRQFRKSRKVGMGISTVQILRCIASTVAVARVWELQQAGWRIVNHGKCDDGSDLYVLEDDEQGPPVEKLLGWEAAVFSTGTRSDAHTHKVSLDEAERLLLDRYMRACLRAWVAQNKPEWAKLV